LFIPKNQSYCDSIGPFDTLMLLNLSSFAFVSSSLISIFLFVIVIIFFSAFAFVFQFTPVLIFELS